MKNGACSYDHDSEGDADATAEPSLPVGARYGDMVGVSAPMKRLFAVLRRLERCAPGVLVVGETGTGKELVARAIHEHSPLRRGPFIAVNCGAFQRDLVQSELFGHVKGAFTGAMRTRAGAFVAADGGTLFLDEVGELPRELQPILLRALEERTVVPVGDHRGRSVNVRVIAATNRDLARAVEEGTFREDLYYRLKVVQVEILPLRERREDIDGLVRCFVERAGGTLPPLATLNAWRRQPWPGNARELRNAVDAYLATGEAPHSPAPKGTAHALVSFVDVDRPYQQLRHELLAEFTRSYVVELLARTHGNVAEASRRSGIERSYLNKLVQRWGARLRCDREASAGSATLSQLRLGLQTND